MPKRATKTPSPDATVRLDQLLQRGLALHQSGRLQDAEGVYRQVLVIASDHPAGNHLLGLARLQQGDPAAAVDFIARAVAKRRDDPQYHCNLGVALNAAGQPERALHSFARAIHLKPDYAEAWSNSGMALKALRRPLDAVEKYRQAIKLRPGEPGFHLNLGNALQAAGEYHEAEASFRKALELRPDYPAALSGLALILEALGRASEAVAAGEAAIVRKPKVSEYHRSVGRAYRAAGRLVDAVASYRRALALNADDTEIYRLLSLCIRRGEVDDEMAAMERLYEEPRLNDEQRLHLAFALGRGFDDIGEHDRACGFFLEGNRILRNRVSFSLDQERRDLLGLGRLFDGIPEPVPGGGSADASPIFILGLPRSGKTSLENALKQHPDARSAGELVVMPRLALAMTVKYGLAQPDADLRRVSPQDWEEMGRAYMERARDIAGGPGRIIDTMPPNFRLIGFIRLALPNARIIHCVRDPLEHCVELFKKHFARPGYEYTADAADLVGYFNLYRELMELWRRQWPGLVLDVDLARVRADPVTEMRRVLGHCGFAWDDRCTIIEESEPRLGPPSRPSSPEERLRPYRTLFAPLLS